MISDQEIVHVITESLEEVGEITLPAFGDSMGRRFRYALGLVIRPVAGGRVGFGSVLVFRRGGRLMAHRIVWMFPPGSKHFCVTKGDAVGLFDRPYVAAGEVVGTVVAVRESNRTRDLTLARERMTAIVSGVRGLVTGLARGVVRRVSKRLAG